MMPTPEHVKGKDARSSFKNGDLKRAEKSLAMDTKSSAIIDSPYLRSLVVHLICMATYLQLPGTDKLRQAA